MKKLRPHLPAIVAALCGLGAGYLRFRGQPGLAAIVDTHATELLLALATVAGAASWSPGRTHEDIRRDAEGAP
jgi:hypothetical protein